MKSIFKSSLYLLPLLFCCLSSCSTVTEVFDEEQSATSYKKTTNEKGETVYKRVKVIEPTSGQDRREELAAKERELMKLNAIQSTPVEEEQSEPSASDSSQTESSVKLAVELSKGSDNTHIGGIVNMDMFDYFNGGIGLSLFTGNDLYFGIDLRLRLIKKMGDFTPFIGIGGYLGDSKRCREDYDLQLGRYVEICEKKFLSAGLAEVGVQYKAVSLFYRRYDITEAGRAVPYTHFFGLGYTFQ